MKCLWEGLQFLVNAEPLAFHFMSKIFIAPRSKPNSVKFSSAWHNSVTMWDYKLAFTVNWSICSQFLANFYIVKHKVNWCCSSHTAKVNSAGKPNFLSFFFSPKKSNIQRNAWINPPLYFLMKIDNVNQLRFCLQTFRQSNTVIHHHKPLMMTLILNTSIKTKPLRWTRTSRMNSSPHKKKKKYMYYIRRKWAIITFWSVGLLKETVKSKT